MLSTNSFILQEKVKGGRAGCVHDTCEYPCRLPSCSAHPHWEICEHLKMQLCLKDGISIVTFSVFQYFRVFSHVYKFSENSLFPNCQTENCKCAGIDPVSGYPFNAILTWWVDIFLISLESCHTRISLESWWTSTTWTLGLGKTNTSRMILTPGVVLTTGHVVAVPTKCQPNRSGYAPMCYP